MGLFQALFGPRLTQKDLDALQKQLKREFERQHEQDGSNSSRHRSGSSDVGRRHGRKSETRHRTPLSLDRYASESDSIAEEEDVLDGLCGRCGGRVRYRVISRGPKPSKRCSSQQPQPVVFVNPDNLRKAWQPEPQYHLPRAPHNYYTTSAPHQGPTAGQQSNFPLPQQYDDILNRVGNGLRQRAAHERDFLHRAETAVQGIAGQGVGQN